jgi:hypothetical protein
MHWWNCFEAIALRIIIITNNNVSRYGRTEIDHYPCIQWKQQLSVIEECRELWSFFLHCLVPL